MEAIGDFYESFPQLSDEKALRLLEQGLERINVTYNS
jgi:predicted phosphoribosyltransferase